jgi:hypothetical protein
MRCAPGRHESYTVIVSTALLVEQSQSSVVTRDSESCSNQTLHSPWATRALCPKCRGYVMLQLRRHETSGPLEPLKGSCQARGAAASATVEFYQYCDAERGYSSFQWDAALITVMRLWALRFRAQARLTISLNRDFFIHVASARPTSRGCWAVPTAGFALRLS